MNSVKAQRNSDPKKNPTLNVLLFCRWLKNIFLAMRNLFLDDFSSRVCLYIYILYKIFVCAYEGLLSFRGLVLPFTSVSPLVNGTSTDFLWFW